jgi:hypothetical protein
MLPSVTKPLYFIHFYTSYTSFADYISIPSSCCKTWKLQQEATVTFLEKVASLYKEHKFSEKMAQKSETIILDVLMKKKANHSDMLDILKVQ